MNFGFMQPQFYPQYGQYGFHSNNTGGSQSNWADEWTVHGSDAGASADRDGDRTGDQSNGTS
jgi:H/ACA ribonucleoprotein complex non-core subunit NAF1